MSEMTKDDWIARALPFVRDTQEWSIWIFENSKSVSEEAKEEFKQQHATLTELVRVAEEEFKITEKGE